ncbi:hypothetical protein [Cellulophaga sp. Hel_I_12]|uniref:hypothetical protein n=1 Tax=Cellulophaga sp. Hel_I_12 TaxID=1249972 RepID=UPI000648092C|nr:hypothetical protein [Cellulophaga sp. Hel_I_12]
MTESMLEYTIVVLKKVSFDTRLFYKEVKKAISILLPEEVEQLKIWLQQFIDDKPELQQSLILITN